MHPKFTTLKLLETIVSWLNRTQGRDKLCKMLQYFCLMMSHLCKNNDYYSLQFQTLFRIESIKDARKVFRLFKSVMEYQKIIDILLDDQDDLVKVFRVLGQVFFFFYWFFDNISILYKIKLFRGNFSKIDMVASIFWLLSLLVMIPVCAIQSQRVLPPSHHPRPSLSATQSSPSNPLPPKWLKKRLLLDSIKYSFDIFPATNDSKILSKLFKIQIHPMLIGIGGFVSAVISTWENIREVQIQRRAG